MSEAFISAHICQLKNLRKSSVDCGDVVGELQFTAKIERLEAELESAEPLTPHEENMLGLRTALAAVKKIESLVDKLIASAENRAAKQ